MFDVLTIAAVADELGATVLDGRLQRIGLVDARTVAAEIYAGGRRHYLVASADDRDHRLQLVPAMPSLDAQLITPFGLLLRKYLRGGVLIGIDQPPLERVVRLSIAKRMLPSHGRGGTTAGLTDDHDAPAAPDVPTLLDDEALAEVDDDAEFAPDANVTYVQLAVELMGRHSNLILIDDSGRIMESAKRVTSSMSRVRPVLPRLPYTPPPPLDRPDPRRATGAAVAAWLETLPEKGELARLLVTGWRGLSPQLAREIVFRTTGDAASAPAAVTAGQAPELARVLRTLFEPLLTAAWAPRVYQDAEGSPIAFSPVPMAHLAARAEAVVTPSISAAATAVFGSDAGGDSPARHQQRRERLLASLGAARERQERRLHAVREQAAQADNIEQLREWGELIYGYLWQIQPGQAALVVDETTSVPLDPELSGKENAQRYFEQYRKAQSAGQRTPELLAATEAELAYLDQMATLTTQAAGFAELEALAAEWETYSGGAPAKGQPRRRQAPPRPRALLDAEGNAVYVGHSGNQNAQITFELAGPNDTWLHARGVPGSHVVIRWRNPAADEREETVAAAAALAAHYSAARGSTSVEVDVARRRHVRKIKGAGPGLVTYRNERTIAVAPAAERDLSAELTGTAI